MRRDRITVVGTMLIFLAFGSPALAALINGDFSAGFVGWMGQVTDLDDLTTDLDPPPGGFTDNFDASTGEAVLTTTTSTNEIWAVFLFQEFFLEPAASGETLLLTYDLSFSLSDDTSGDAAFAQLNFGLSGGFFTGTINLLGMSSLDATSLGGQTVEIL